MRTIPDRSAVHLLLLLLSTFLVVGCGVAGVELRAATATATTKPSPIVLVSRDSSTATPLLPTATPAFPTPTATPSPTRTPAPTPTAVPGSYHVRAGDTLLSIAIQHNMALEQLLALNNMDGTELLQIDQMLTIPNGIALNLPEAFLVPDSEVVYGAAYESWNTQVFLEEQGGYLAQYSEWERSGAEIIDAVARKYHVSPRVLLAAIEMLSGWVSGREPHSLVPFGLEDGGPPNLNWQATWAAKKLMEGYYGQLEGRRDWVVLDNGVPARLYPGTNPGTAAVANLLAGAEPALTFPELLQSDRFQDTYRRLFGEVEGGSVLPPDSEQPYLELPFPEEELWYFSGGPHGGYGDGWSGWAALDFAPPVATGCWPSRYPVRAVAPGLVMHSAEGETWVDLDGDGNFRTGWAIFIMHLAANSRVAAGAWVETGDVLGYPSCEGGISTGAHLHIARMYNGQWMPADGPVPFQLGDWTTQAVIGSSYDGILLNSDGRILKACDCRSARKNRFPEHRYPGQP